MAVQGQRGMKTTSGLSPEDAAAIAARGETFVPMPQADTPSGKLLSQQRKQMRRAAGAAAVTTGPPVHPGMIVMMRHSQGAPWRPGVIINDDPADIEILQFDHRPAGFRTVIHDAPTGPAWLLVDEYRARQNPAPVVAESEVSEESEESESAPVKKAAKKAKKAAKKK